MLEMLFYTACLLHAAGVHRPYSYLEKYLRNAILDGCGVCYRMDGWIVCEEHKDVLLAAWDEEQEIIREKEAQVASWVFF